MFFTKAVIASSLLAAPLANAQVVSSLSSLAASAVSTSAEADASASATSSMAPSASASGSSNSSDSAYLDGVLGALTAAGLTSLVSVASSIAQTPDGMELLASLANGNKTVFAPSNDAFDAVPESVSSNTTLLTQILSYHILNNTYSGEGIATSPNHTIARTLLRGGEFMLPNNRTAPLVLERSNMTSNSTEEDDEDSSMPQGGFSIVQTDMTMVGNGTAAANLQVYVIDSVLSLPQNLSALAGVAFPTLAGVIEQAGLLTPLENARGVTIFAPSDDALAKVSGELGGLNASDVQTLLMNHVINGTVVYANEISPDANLTSAAGEPFQFMSNSSGTYVMSGNATAMITTTDIILNNGVVHTIDSVLLNTMMDSEAADDAYESNTAAAGTQTDPTGEITATSQPAGTGGAGGDSDPSGAAGRAAPLGVTNAMIGGAVGVVAAVFGGGFLLI